MLSHDNLGWSSFPASLHSIYDFLNMRVIKVAYILLFFPWETVFTFNKPLLNVCHVPDPAELEGYIINQLTPALMELRAELGGQPETLTLMTV